MSERDRQQDIELAEYIISQVEERGFPPSRQEIADHLGLTAKSTVQARMERLIREGIIERTVGVQRGIKVNRQRLHEFGEAK